MLKTMFNLPSRMAFVDLHASWINYTQLKQEFCFKRWPRVGTREGTLLNKWNCYNDKELLLAKFLEIGVQTVNTVLQNSLTETLTLRTSKITGTQDFQDPKKLRRRSRKSKIPKDFHETFDTIQECQNSPTLSWNLLLVCSKGSRDDSVRPWNKIIRNQRHV